MLRRLILIALGVVGAVALLLAVSVAVVFVQSRNRNSGKADYVALGSSFASGPGVGERAEGSPTLCLRSATNYPQLVAKQLGLTLDDVTCSAATSAHVLDTRQMFLPPQIEAVQPATRLVTVTVGGNDIAYMANAIAWACESRPQSLPFLWRHLACRVTPNAMVDRSLLALPNQLRRIASEVRKRAPGARLVFVDYLRVFPNNATCPDRAPLNPHQLARARLIGKRLSRITATVASQTGALLVPATMSRGHDVCSREPWVFGLEFPGAMFSWGSMGFHPNQAGMQAIARAVVDKLK